MSEALCLDSLITKNRDRATLRLATPADLLPLIGQIGDVDVLDIIDDWRLIAQCLDGAAVVCVLGRSRRDQCTWVTSSIVCIDQETVRTAHSYYGLGQQGIGDPPRDQLRLLIHYLRRKGVGAVLGLPEL